MVSRVGTVDGRPTVERRLSHKARVGFQRVAASDFDIHEKRLGFRAALRVLFRPALQ
jgi:hypothetical protein